MEQNNAALRWLLGCTILVLTPARLPAASAKPHVLLISIDDLNDWVGVLGGHPQAATPNIDRLARRGVLFTNAHCQAPVCTSSRISLVTSRLPSSTGLYFLRPLYYQVRSTHKMLTLAERFAQEGYKTLGVGKVYDARDDEYLSRYGGRKGGFGPRPKQKINHPIGHPYWDWGAYPASDAPMPDTRVADWAIKRLGEKHDQPLFLCVGFFRPHVPMYVPQKWLDMHPLAKVRLPKVLETDRDDLPGYGRLLSVGHLAPRHEWFEQNQQQWEKAVQAYLASCTFVDHCVGRLLDALAASPQAKNTIVVLFSDHGFHLGEKRRWAKRSIWEDSTHVPLIFDVPGMKGGLRSGRPVGLIDIYPTLLDLCGLKSDSSHQGHSLVPLLNDPDAAWQQAAITTFGPHNHAVRSTRWRYIRYRDGSQELYDHRNDPHEWHNLAANPQYAEVIKQHSQWLPKLNKPPILDYPSAGLSAYLDAEKARLNFGK